MVLYCISFDISILIHMWCRYVIKSFLFYSILFYSNLNVYAGDADESWPEQLGDKPMMKLSESASKSVLSLGKIVENNENQMSSSEDDDSMADNGTGDKIVNDIMEKLNTILVTKNHDRENNETVEPGEKQIDEKDMGKTITISEPYDGKPVDQSSKLEEYETDNEESELIRTESTTDKSENDETPNHKSQSQVDYVWSELHFFLNKYITYSE